MRPTILAKTLHAAHVAFHAYGISDCAFLSLKTTINRVLGGRAAMSPSRAPKLGHIAPDLALTVENVAEILKSAETRNRSRILMDLLSQALENPPLFTALLQALERIEWEAGWTVASRFFRSTIQSPNLSVTSAPVSDQPGNLFHIARKNGPLPEPMSSAEPA